MPAELDERLRNEIMDHIFAGRKIEAIKRYREATGSDLKEAKEYLDDLTDQLRQTHPERFGKADGRSGCGGQAAAFLALAAWLWLALG